jgi:hypothetical protein
MVGKLYSIDQLIHSLLDRLATRGFNQQSLELEE